MPIIKILVFATIFCLTNFANAVTRECSVDLDSIIVARFDVGTSTTHGHYKFSAVKNGELGVKFLVVDMNDGSIVISTSTGNFGHSIPDLDLSVDSRFKTAEGYYHVGCY